MFSEIGFYLNLVLFFVRAKKLVHLEGHHHIAFEFETSLHKCRLTGGGSGNDIDEDVFCKNDRAVRLSRVDMLFARNEGGGRVAVDIPLTDVFDVETVNARKTYSEQPICATELITERSKYCRGGWMDIMGGHNWESNSTG